MIVHVEQIKVKVARDNENSNDNHNNDQNGTLPFHRTDVIRFIAGLLLICIDISSSIDFIPIWWTIILLILLK